MSTTGGAERQPALLGPGGTAGSSGPGEADGAGRSTVAVRPAPRVDVVVHVSREALRRGSVEPGELCTVQGVGPIPLERARELLDDAFLKAVLVDGTRVETVRHLGRRIPAELRTALEVRSVLADGDVVCSVEGCDRRTGLPCGPGVPTPAQRG
ncbi:MAG: hypothetical protein M5U14_09790 [Acidimicrobiia bacterium]|nr:hypothetical protein [Acidimicrobiia bacterium]